MAALFCNLIVFSLIWTGQPTEMIKILDYIGMGFNAIFLLECLFKIVAFGTVYFKIGENIFDFTIALITTCSMVNDLLGLN